VAGNDDKKALPSLDGTYLMIGVEKGGEKLPGESISMLPEDFRTYILKGDKLIPPAMGAGKEPVAAKLDPSKTPAHFTTTEKKDGKIETMVGIYKLEGDILTICMVPSDKEEDRPKEFKSAKDSKTIIITLKKKDK
jgi:uncharacterized protein (TIGR03067 family)